MTKVIKFPEQEEHIAVVYADEDTIDRLTNEEYDSIEFKDIAEKDNEIALYKRAFEMACKWIDSMAWQDNCCETPTTYEYILTKAREEE